MTHRTIADLAAELVATLTDEERTLLAPRTVDLAEALHRRLTRGQGVDVPWATHTRAPAPSAMLDTDAGVAALTCPKCGGRRWTHVQHDAQVREGKVYRADDGTVGLFMDDGTMQGYDAGIDYLYCGARLPHDATDLRTPNDECGHRIPMPDGVEYEWGVRHGRPVKGWTEVE
jgi:hypothetical protein